MGDPYPKEAGPWDRTSDDDGQESYRSGADVDSPRGLPAYVVRKRTQWVATVRFRKTPRGFPTRAEAEAWCDDQLRKAGYLLEEEHDGR
tara:strand:- start:745 stop:1011 length:267 start_codon:yes stop_codon:yes gene_type:complete